MNYWFKRINDKYLRTINLEMFFQDFLYAYKISLCTSNIRNDMEYDTNNGLLYIFYFDLFYRTWHLWKMLYCIMPIYYKKYFKIIQKWATVLTKWRSTRPKFLSLIFHSNCQKSSKLVFPRKIILVTLSVQSVQWSSQALLLV